MGDEITTPMKTLSSMLHLLSEYNLPEEPRELLNIARRSANTLINNLNNILDFSKLDANLLKLQKSDFEIRQLFDEVTSEYTPHAESKSLKLSSYVSPEVPDAIFNDSRRVRQIIKNLLGNAIRFTKEGEVKLTCDLVMQNSVQFLRITVSDTGVGIPKEAQKGLFDSLEQKTKLTNSSFAGRLRLIVSKKLAELMGGTIGVESEPQRGSTFWFTIAIR
jgi:signal transduction histidine kinase